VGRDKLHWIFTLQPTPLSLTYTLALTYEGGVGRPVVRVLDPPLERPDGEGLPHVFEDDVLCLYYDEFDGTRSLIADVVVPWVSEWLFHYELWLTTKEWHGGGLHPGADQAAGV
jgi:hypothetical protein